MSTGGRYTRAADGTFMGEWGAVQTYASSPWSASIAYWAAEAHSSNVKYLVNTSGLSGGSIPGDFFGAVCKR